MFKEIPIEKPISSTPPSNINNKVTKSTLTLMTSTEWDSDTMDPTGWYLSEKYDGMRLYWNGLNFYSRQGNIVKVPDTIKLTMPSTPLDGELWYQNT